MIEGIQTHEPVGCPMGKLAKLRKTLEAVETLTSAGYAVADLSSGMITMRCPSFRRLVEDHGGSCAVQPCGPHFRVSLLWLDGIEISFTEERDTVYVLDENWKPL